jgi:thioredoxin 1
MGQNAVPINVTDAAFERAVLGAALPVVAVFWSARETPREALNALLEGVASRYSGDLVVAKLEVADAPQARARFGVEALPEFLFLRDGKLVARAKGLPSLQALVPWIEYLLRRGPRPVPAEPRSQSAARPPDHPLEVTDADFERVVLGASLPVLVDCWAAWCGPCRMVAPAVEALAREFAGRALVAKLDVDANPATARRYGVQSIPTLLYFLNGQEVDRVVGAQPIEVLRQRLARLAK